MTTISKKLHEFILNHEPFRIIGNLFFVIYLSKNDDKYKYLYDFTLCALSAIHKQLLRSVLDILRVTTYLLI